MVFAVVGGIMVVGLLTHCALLHNMYDLKATQINEQHCLIWELMLYEFKQGHNPTEATKSLCCMKDESTVDHNIVTIWLKKLYSACKSADDQIRSAKPKTMDSMVVLHSIEADPVISTQKVSSKIGISQSHSGVLLYYHYFQVPSDSEWSYLLGSHPWFK